MSHARANQRRPGGEPVVEGPVDLVLRPPVCRPVRRRARGVRGTVAVSHSRASARAAALAPHMPWAPAPGGVDAEHRYVPGMPVKYGSIAKRGRNNSWVSEDAPPMMSPPT